MIDRQNSSESLAPENAIQQLAQVIESGPVVLSVGSGPVDRRLFRPEMLIEARIRNWSSPASRPPEDGAFSAEPELCERRTELLLADSDALSIFPDKTADTAVLAGDLALLDRAEGWKVIEHLLRIARRQAVIPCGVSVSSQGEHSSGRTGTVWRPEDFDGTWQIVFQPEQIPAASGDARPFYAIRTFPKPGYRYRFSRKTLVIAETALPQGRFEKRAPEESELEGALYSIFKDVEPSSFMISGTWDFQPYPANSMYDPAVLAERRHPIQYIYMPGMLNHAQEVIESQNFSEISEVSEIPPLITHLAENYYEKIFKPLEIDFFLYIGRPNIAAFCLIYLMEKYGIKIRILDYEPATASDGQLYLRYAERFKVKTALERMDSFAVNLTSSWERPAMPMPQVNPPEEEPEPAAQAPAPVQVDLAPFPFLRRLELTPAADASQLDLYLSGCKLEIAPAPHTTVRGLQVRGSFMLKGAGTDKFKLKAIRVIWDTETLSETSYWGHSATASSYSFSINAGLIGTGPHCDLTVVLYLENAEAEEDLPHAVYFSAGTIKVERVAPAWSRDSAGDPAAIHPLLVSGLGRSGTTLLMKLLLSHPKIAGWDVHPYEGQAAQYWLNAARILLQPRDVRPDVPVTAFQQAMNKIFRNPFLSHPFMADPAEHNPVLEWADHTHVPQTIEFFKRQIDQYYKALAKECGKEGAVFFAEKTQPNMHSEIFNEVYGNPAELTLVRHPFDVLCSVRSFFPQVEFYKTDEYISALNLGYERMLYRLDLEDRRNKVILYEDMISSPQETMSGVFKFIGLEAFEMPASGATDGAANSHITSASSESSVHRWKQDLSASDQELAKAVFESTMKKMAMHLPGFDPGYPV